MAFGPDGSLYLTDGSSIRKVTMDETVTTLVRKVMLENASGNSAGGSSLFGIAVDAQGNAFVADYGNRRILKVAPDGQMTTLVRAEESWFPTGVAERGGEIYILRRVAHADISADWHSCSPAIAGRKSNSTRNRRRKQNII